MQCKFRWRAFLVASSVLVACVSSRAIGAGTLNEWDVMCALRDLVHRSIALEFIKIDPYQLVDARRRETNLDAPLCSAKAVKEGLVNGTCNPVMMKKCGTQCVELSMDSGVYSRASKQIERDLRAPCRWLPALKLGQGRRDHHPSFFYLSRNRSVASLGCAESPVAIDTAVFTANKLIIKYRASPIAAKT
ncbi:MAG TPA: hypothetical protein VNA21_15805 [Steroidobacteraceae bacterium]|nr:hypothetical protein [Steroidobacteraceae bacterium]